MMVFLPKMFLIVVAEILLMTSAERQGTCPNYLNNGTWAEDCQFNENETCTFECEDNFNKNENITGEVTCLSSGEWNIDLNLLCIESLNPTTIPNGTVDTDCDRQQYSFCTFTCNPGFDYNPENDDNRILCTPYGTWSLIEHEPGCKERQGICTNYLQKGKWSKDCQFNENETCTFECNPFCKKTITGDVTCLSSGEWNIDPSSICIDILCPDTIPNGLLNFTDCGRTHYQMCPFECNTGFEKDPNNLSLLRCRNGTWAAFFHAFYGYRFYPACNEKKGLCANYFLNGRFTNDCEFKENDSCSFECAYKYDRNKNIKKNVTCMSSSEWDVDLKTLCVVNYMSLIVTMPEDIDDDGGYIFGAPMETNGHVFDEDYDLYSIESDLQFYSVSGDYELGHIYAYDYNSSAIFEYQNFPINGDAYAKENWKPYHNGLSKGFVKLAVDWVSHNIYWTDPHNKSIVLQSLLSNDSSMHCVLIHNNLEAPHALALDPMEALIFWSDIGTETKIEVSNLSGKNRKHLISSDLIKPYSLAADYTNKRIYFTDAGKNVVETATYDGQDRKIVVTIADGQFYDIAVFKDYLYVTSIKKDVVYFFNKTNGEEIGNKLSSKSFFGLTVFNIDAQPIPEQVYCADYGCQHICVTEKDGATCLCKDGYELEDDNKSCSPSMSN